MYSLVIDPQNTESVAAHLKYPDTLKTYREDFAFGIVEAYKIVLSFSELYNWRQYLQNALFNSVQIFDSQKDLWNKIRKLTGAMEEKPPTDGLSAALIDGQLMCVTPEMYAQIRPEYNQINNAWQKLLAHEMIHELHIRLVGDEEKMGPQWFYEGFAMYGSGQRFGNHIKSIEEALAAMHSQSRGSYAKYSAVFEFFIERVDLEIMLRRAAKEDFESWLISITPNNLKN